MRQCGRATAYSLIAGQSSCRRRAATAPTFLRLHGAGGALVPSEGAGSTDKLKQRFELRQQSEEQVISLRDHQTLALRTSAAHLAALCAAFV